MLSLTHSAPSVCSDAGPGRGPGTRESWSKEMLWNGALATGIRKPRFSPPVNRPMSHLLKIAPVSLPLTLPDMRMSWEEQLCKQTWVPNLADKRYFSERRVAPQRNEWAFARLLGLCDDEMWGCWGVRAHVRWPSGGSGNTDSLTTHLPCSL